ncbi:MAG: HNH endonuclease [Proteobacteria bacterium]|nr:HNH endonuclease [Pseudomonadota bacterium]
MARTLVLNAAYEPIHLVSWEKAMCLVFTSKAEIVAEYDSLIRSVSQIFKMPSVVRLKKYVKTFRKTMNARCTRKNILMRDRFNCQYCGQNCSVATVTIDHVFPRSRGGKTTWDNVVAACHPCNRKKADRTPSEASMPLLRVPRRPSWVDLLEESHRTLLESWMPFLMGKATG